MPGVHTPEQLDHLVRQFVALPNEISWVEFKQNNTDSQMIGERISGLSNSAALAGEPYGYVLWGIEDASHRLVGTNFDPSTAKHNSTTEIQNWLTVNLRPQIFFEFNSVSVDNVNIVVLTIEAANYKPVSFRGIEYVRVGSYTKKLSDHESLERRLWQSFDQQPFEDRSALENQTEDDVIRLLDYPAYFDLTKAPLPDNKRGIVAALAADGLIARMPGTGWRVTNLGGLLFAKQLSDFPSLERKALRVIHYKGTSLLHPIREQLGTKGYASGFQGLITYINGLLPTNEVMGQALRSNRPMYPELAVRELVANALIHQNFSVTGTGPVVSLSTTDSRS